MYVVTGASGNTGAVVADHLSAAGKKVRGISRQADHLRRLTAKGGEAITAQATDREALTRAFHDAEGVYLMIPPDMTISDVHGYQQKVTDAYAYALENAQVQHAVVLSSIGADKDEGTGPVLGLHRMEERLKGIDGLNVLFLRAGYFMENTLMQAQMIPKLGMTVGPLRPDLKLPMIATEDIGSAAADALLKNNFHGHQTRELLGQRDLDYNEATRIIGNAIGKRTLAYSQPPNTQLRTSLEQMGMSSDFVRLLLEMCASLNSGHMRPLEQRNPRNTTPTSYDSFVEEKFIPMYRSRQAA